MKRHTSSKLKVKSTGEQSAYGRELKLILRGIDNFTKVESVRQLRFRELEEQVIERDDVKRCNPICGQNGYPLVI